MIDFNSILDNGNTSFSKCSWCFFHLLFNQMQVLNISLSYLSLFGFLFLFPWNCRLLDVFEICTFNCFFELFSLSLFLKLFVLEYFNFHFFLFPHIFDSSLFRIKFVNFFFRKLINALLLLSKSCCLSTCKLILHQVNSFFINLSQTICFMLISFIKIRQQILITEVISLHRVCQCISMLVFQWLVSSLLFSELKFLFVLSVFQFRIFLEHILDNFCSFSCFSGNSFTFIFNFRLICKVTLFRLIWTSLFKSLFSFSSLILLNIIWFRRRSTIVHKILFFSCSLIIHNLWSDFHLSNLLLLNSFSLRECFLLRLYCFCSMLYKVLFYLFIPLGFSEIKFFSWVNMVNLMFWCSWCLRSSTTLWYSISISVATTFLTTCIRSESMLICLLMSFLCN